MDLRDVIVHNWDPKTTFSTPSFDIYHKIGHFRLKSDIYWQREKLFVKFGDIFRFLWISWNNFNYDLEILSNFKIFVIILIVCKEFTKFGKKCLILKNLWQIRQNNSNFMADLEKWAKILQAIFQRYDKFLFLARDLSSKLKFSTVIVIFQQKTNIFCTVPHGSELR